MYEVWKNFCNFCFKYFWVEFGFDIEVEIIKWVGLKCASKAAEANQLDSSVPSNNLKVSEKTSAWTTKTGVRISKPDLSHLLRVVEQPVSRKWSQLSRKGNKTVVPLHENTPRHTVSVRKPVERKTFPTWIRSLYTPVLLRLSFIQIEILRDWNFFFQETEFWMEEKNRVALLWHRSLSNSFGHRRCRDSDWKRLESLARAKPDWLLASDILPIGERGTQPASARSVCSVGVRLEPALFGDTSSIV